MTIHSTKSMLVSHRALPMIRQIRTPLKKLNGFTLIELMIVVAILSILVAVATPVYSNYIKQSKITEALASLGRLSTQMEKNYLDFKTYGNNGCAISSPNSNNYSYACESNGQDYTWTATSSDGDFVFSVNNNFNKATLAYDGQSLSAVDCWMISESGSCY